MKAFYTGVRQLALDSAWPYAEGCSSGASPLDQKLESSMCRILGVVADASAEFRFCLRDAPRSLGVLSREHPDGWGVAVFEEEEGWELGKEPLSAFADPRFGEVAGESKGRVLVAHVRKRTVGPVSRENTHPFQRGRWVFAHNGTIAELERLRASASAERLAEVEGTTDSEVFFAFLLTRIDEARTPQEVDEALVRALREVAATPSFGACNFLLSDGELLYAFRRGRTLFTLERSLGDVAKSPRARRAVLVASEQISQEPWQAVEEGTLLKITRRPQPELTILAAL
jgi:glutamine amidotransferase